MNQAGTAPSFEALRDTIGNAVPAGAPGVREAVALEPTGSLAAARDPDGRLELFLLGPELQPRLATVRERLVYDTWAGANALRFTANRILLPAGHHIDAVAALICTELLTHGYPQGPLDAFVKAEPVIDLVLTPATQAGHILTGLAGELTFLAALVDAERSAAAEHVVAAWHGWRPSSRDFQLGPVGVEVKTSTTGASTHRIQGWYQVEPGAAVDGTQETSLYLLSLGIRWLRHGAPGESIEGLLEQISGGWTPRAQPSSATGSRGTAASPWSWTQKAARPRRRSSARSPSSLSASSTCPTPSSRCRALQTSRSSPTCCRTRSSSRSASQRRSGETATPSPPSGRSRRRSSGLRGRDVCARPAAGQTVGSR